MSPEQPPEIGPPSVEGISQTLLARLDPPPTAEALSRATMIRRTVAAWARRYPAIDDRTGFALVFGSVVAAPWCSDADISWAARDALTITAIDDFFDTEFRISSIDDFARRCLQATDGQPCDSVFPAGLFSALADISQELRVHPLYAELGSKRRYNFSRLIQGMQQEARWREMLLREGPVALPDYQEYLDHATFSIGVPAQLWGLLTAFGDRTVVDHLTQITELVHAAAHAIRLANDFMTCDREKDEGNVNAVTIRQHFLSAGGMDPGAAETAAREQVRHDALHHVHRCQRLAQHVNTATGCPERIVVGYARFYYDFYTCQDFHKGSQRSCGRGGDPTG